MMKNPPSKPTTNLRRSFELPPLFDRRRFNLLILTSLFVLGLTPFTSTFWFFIPLATVSLLETTWWPLRAFPFAVLGVLVAIARDHSWTALDWISVLLLFFEGYVLLSLRLKRLSFTQALLWPLFIGFAAGLGAFVAQRFYGLQKLSYDAWAEKQILSDILPAFFRADFYNEATLPLYQSLYSILKASLLGIFAAIMAMAYFINATFHNLFQSASFFEGSPKTRKNWEVFTRWKAPEAVLILLVAGLSLLVVQFKWPDFHRPAFSFWGWNLAILAAFPIGLQGTALAFFLIPRVTVFFSVLIFVLLVVNPIPVLVLAGILDLWFDFRSRVPSKPDGPKD